LAPLKIAVNTRLLLSDKMEGIGWFTYETMKRIAAAHPEVSFHFLFDRPFDDSFIFSENIKGHFLGPPARHSSLQKIWNNYSVPLILSKIKPDLYLSPDAQLSMRARVKQHIVIHDINFEHYPKDIPNHYYQYLHKYTPLFIKKAARIATVSAFSRTDIANRYNVDANLIDIVPNGVNDSFRPLNKAETSVAKARYAKACDYFIAVGSIHPRKNLQRLLPAFDQFKSRNPSNTKLLLVGNEMFLTTEVKEAMKHLKHKKDVIFAGRLGANDLSMAIGAAIANVYISYFEGFGIPVLEGFKCGVPVIAANATSIPEVAGNAAHLVDPFDINDISNALQKVHNDKLYREELIKRGFKQVQKFSWENTAQLLWQSMMKAL